MLHIAIGGGGGGLEIGKSRCHSKFSAHGNVRLRRSYGIVTPSLFRDTKKILVTVSFRLAWVSSLKPENFTRGLKHILDTWGKVFSTLVPLSLLCQYMIVKFVLPSMVRLISISQYTIYSLLKQNMDVNDKKPYQDNADKDKIRYDKEMANYKPSKGDKKKGKKRKKKDPNAPKRNL